MCRSFPSILVFLDSSTTSVLLSLDKVYRENVEATEAPRASNVIDRGSATGNNAAAIHERPFKPLPRCRAICIVNHRPRGAPIPKIYPLMVAGSFAEELWGCGD